MVIELNCTLSGANIYLHLLTQLIALRFSTHFIQNTSCISFLCTLASGQGFSPAQGYCRVNPDLISMGRVLKTLDPDPVDFVSFSNSGLDRAQFYPPLFFFFLIVCFLLPLVFVAAWPFSSCTERGPRFPPVRRRLTAAASRCWHRPQARRLG